MEKRKRWHFYLIVAVLALTVYNILPTVFYYTKPLKQPIGEKQAAQISEQIAERVNRLETDTVDWLWAFSKNLGIKPTQIEPVAQDPKLVRLVFKNAKEANVFRRYLPHAGALIPFVPAQLAPGPILHDQSAQEVLVERNVSTHFDLKSLPNYFAFSKKRDAQGNIAPFYNTLVEDRVVRVALSAGGISEAARLVQAAGDSEASVDDAEYVALAQQILDYERSFGLSSPISTRFFASFTQVASGDRSALIHGLVARFDQIQRELKGEIDAIQSTDGQPLELAQKQRRNAMEKQRETLDRAQTVIRSNVDLFRSGKEPLTSASVLELLERSGKQRVDLGGRNPFIQAVVVDWEGERILLPLYPEVEKLREAADLSEESALASDKLNRLLINEVAALSRSSDESVLPAADAFTIALDQLPGSQSVLSLNLGAVAKQKVSDLRQLLKTAWAPSSTDFAADVFPISDYATYQTLPLEQQRLGLVVYAPAMESGDPLPGFRTGSVYVIARGLAQIDQKVAAAGEGSAAASLKEDFLSLRRLMASSGFVAYPAAAYGLPAEFRDDYIFELDDYYGYLLMATREDFVVKGTKRYAVLEFTDYEQRLLKRNQIQTQSHEDLIKWADEYKTAQVNPDPQARFHVPPPTKNVWLSNLKLSASKYFRGDNRKILKWGLDLSGGKSVTIGLRDRLNRPVTDPDDLREAVNQLYTRVNKMGVSEVEIRTEGTNVVLSFPGAQNWSAEELVQGSTMFFHIVNEKYSPNNRALAPAVNAFLQEVWNEAVVTGRKDATSINEIAWEHLGGELDDEGISRPRSEAAQQLWESGLRLANPQTAQLSASFDDSVSSIAVFRGESYSEWHGQATPLLIAFHHYALDGTNLQNVHGEYDPSRGNTLVFSVARSGVTADGATVSPQADLHAWSSHFAKDRIAGTPNELYSRGEGWRMAVILNDSVISAPRLQEPLREHGSVTGNFSQREVNQLVADFKAGSLTFTPKILSERNVSPDLGHEERFRGILSAVIGLVGVVAVMIAYYRFAGVVASVAVIANLLIIWGVLQNLGAALTLPGIAGIVLTMGMAVDANVLVFERVREEFRLSGRIASAVASGYRRAFTAIIDSNLTTLIAALILLHFDTGPIKAFAVTLIIGIASSMFTALFMTRFFFAGWIQNPEHRELRMAKLFNQTRFDFLGKAKIAIVASIVLVVVGAALITTQRHTLFGMDFTGGYSLNIAVQEKSDVNYRQKVVQALLAGGASSSDIQVRELNRPSNLRVQLGTGLEQRGGPFAELPQAYEVVDPTYPFETNPRIVWVVRTLQAQGIQLQPESLQTLETQWNVMSGQFSDTMRNQALWGLGLALLAILIYITFRFEFKYAVSAVVALVHDLLVTVGLVAVLHALGLGVQIDLQVIGALMTIIGYSLNDTIVIFDRIREDGRTLRKLKYPELINHALNATLSRTVMTSGTTLVVLLALVFVGGRSLFDFALVMTIGVFLGTFSSLFIAAPALLYFHRREEKPEGSSTAVTKA